MGEGVSHRPEFERAPTTSLAEVMRMRTGHIYNGTSSVVLLLNSERVQSYQQLLTYELLDRNMNADFEAGTNGIACDNSKHGRINVGGFLPCNPAREPSAFPARSRMSMDSLAPSEHRQRSLITSLCGAHSCICL